MVARRITAGAAHVTTDAAALAVAPGLDPEAALVAWEHQAAEGMRRLRRDCIDDLRERGRITTAEMRAADEIALILEWQAGEHSGQVRSQFAARLAATTGGSALWLSLLDAEGRHFAAWKTWAREFPVKPGRSLYALTFAVVVDGFGISQIEKLLRMDRRRALALLRRSLAHYAHAAGWTSNREPEHLA